MCMRIQSLWRVELSDIFVQKFCLKGSVSWYILNGTIVRMSYDK